MENNTNMTVTNGNVSADEIASMQSQISELTRQLTERNASVGRLNERLESIRVQRDEVIGDWRLLNSFLNKYADDQSMCGEYERKIAEWNEQFQVVKLEGRIREYEVEVEVSFRYTHTVTVEASSEEDAKEMVEQMTASEVMESADWDCPDYEEFEINSVEPA